MRLIEYCARDLARFGQMIAQGGFFNGEQIIPSAWIKDLVEGNQTLRSLFEMSDYGVMRPGGHYHNQFWVSAPEDETLCVLESTDGLFTSTSRTRL